MARRRRRKSKTFSPQVVVSATSSEVRRRVGGKLREFYSENIHITRSIDEQLLKMSSKWRSLDQDKRYKLIHTGLGVQFLFDYAESLEEP